MRLSDAEWRVMNAIWDRPVESSVRDVLEQVEPQTGWAYQTVQTIMVRLTRKGALVSRLRANTRLYKAAVSREEAQQTALDSLAEKAFKGSVAPLVVEMVRKGKLGREEKEELSRLLKEESKKKN
jgi:BlaI family transcriptional regulator, penicillinase repressor